MESSILSQLNSIFADILDNPNIRLTEKTKAADVEEWDSLNHIQLVVAIEKHFKVKFSAQEIQNWQNVGEIAESIAKRS